MWYFTKNETNFQISHGAITIHKKIDRISISSSKMLKRFGCFLCLCGGGGEGGGNKIYIFLISDKVPLIVHIYIWKKQSKIFSRVHIICVVFS